MLRIIVTILILTIYGTNITYAGGGGGANCSIGNARRDQAISGSQIDLMSQAKAQIGKASIAFSQPVINFPVAKCNTSTNGFLMFSSTKPSSSDPVICATSDSDSGACWVRYVGVINGKPTLDVCYIDIAGTYKCMAANTKLNGILSNVTVTEKVFDESDTGYACEYGSTESLPECSTAQQINADGYVFKQDILSGKYNFNPSDNNAPTTDQLTICRNIITARNLIPPDCMVPINCPCDEKCAKNKYMPTSMNGLSQLTKDCYKCNQKQRLGLFHCLQEIKNINSDIKTYYGTTANIPYLNNIYGNGSYLCADYCGTRCGCAKIAPTGGPRYMPRIARNDNINPQNYSCSGDAQNNPTCNMFLVAPRLRQFLDVDTLDDNACSVQTRDANNMVAAELGPTYRGTFFRPRAFLMFGQNQMPVVFCANCSSNNDYTVNIPIDCLSSTGSGTCTSSVGSSSSSLSHLQVTKFDNVVYNIVNTYFTQSGSICTQVPTSESAYVMLRLETNTKTGTSALVAYQVEFLTLSAPSGYQAASLSTLTKDIQYSVMTASDFNSSVRNGVQSIQVQNNGLSTASATDFLASYNKSAYVKLTNIGAVNRPPIKFFYNNGSIISQFSIQGNSNSALAATSALSNAYIVSVTPSAISKDILQGYGSSNDVQLLLADKTLQTYSDNTYLITGIAYTTLAKDPSTSKFYMSGPTDKKCGYLYGQQFCIDTNQCGPLINLVGTDGMTYLQSPPSSISTCKTLSDQQQQYACYLSVLLIKSGLCQPYLACDTSYTSTSGCQSAQLPAPQIALTETDALLDYKMNTDIRQTKFLTCLQPGQGMELPNYLDSMSNIYLYGAFGEQSRDNVIAYKRPSGSPFSGMPTRPFTKNGLISNASNYNPYLDDPNEIINVPYTFFGQDRDISKLLMILKNTMINDPNTGLPPVDTTKATSVFNSYITKLYPDNSCDDLSCITVRQKKIYEYGESPFCGINTNTISTSWSFTSSRRRPIDYSVYIPLRCQYFNISAYSAGGAGATEEKGSRCHSHVDVSDNVPPPNKPDWPSSYQEVSNYVSKFSATGASGGYVSIILDVNKLSDNNYDGFLDLQIGERTGACYAMFIGTDALNCVGPDSTPCRDCDDAGCLWLTTSSSDTHVTFLGGCHIFSRAYEIALQNKNYGSYRHLDSVITKINNNDTISTYDWIGNTTINVTRGVANSAASTYNVGSDDVLTIRKGLSQIDLLHTLEDGPNVGQYQQISGVSTKLPIPSTAELFNPYGAVTSVIPHISTDLNSVAQSTFNPSYVYGTTQNINTYTVPDCTICGSSGSNYYPPTCPANNTYLGEGTIYKVDIINQYISDTDNSNNAVTDCSSLNNSISSGQQPFVSKGIVTHTNAAQFTSTTSDCNVVFSGSATSNTSSSGCSFTDGNGQTYSYPSGTSFTDTSGKTYSGSFSQCPSAGTMSSTGTVAKPCACYPVNQTNINANGYSNGPYVTTTTTLNTLATAQGTFKAKYGGFRMVCDTCCGFKSDNSPIDSCGEYMMRSDAAFTVGDANIELPNAMTLLETCIKTKKPKCALIAYTLPSAPTTQTDTDNNGSAYVQMKNRGYSNDWPGYYQLTDASKFISNVGSDDNNLYIGTLGDFLYHDTISYPYELTSSGGNDIKRSCRNKYNDGDYCIGKYTVIERADCSTDQTKCLQFLADYKNRLTNAFNNVFACKSSSTGQTCATYLSTSGNKPDYQSGSLSSYVQYYETNPASYAKCTSGCTGDWSRSNSQDMGEDTKNFVGSAAGQFEIKRAIEEISWVSANSSAIANPTTTSSSTTKQCNPQQLWCQSVTVTHNAFCCPCATKKVYSTSKATGDNVAVNGFDMKVAIDHASEWNDATIVNSNINSQNSNIFPAFNNVTINGSGYCTSKEQMFCASAIQDVAQYSIYNMFNHTPGTAGAFWGDKCYTDGKSAAAGGTGQITLQIASVKTQSLNGITYPLLDSNGLKTPISSTSSSSGTMDPQCSVKCPPIHILYEDQSVNAVGVNLAGVSLLCEYTGDPLDDMEGRISQTYAPNKCYIVDVGSNDAKYYGMIIVDSGTCPILKCANSVYDSSTTNSTSSTYNFTYINRYYGLCTHVAVADSSGKKMGDRYYTMLYNKNVYTGRAFEGGIIPGMQIDSTYTPTGVSNKLAVCGNNQPKDFLQDAGTLKQSKYKMQCMNNGFWQNAYDATAVIGDGSKDKYHVKDAKGTSLTETIIKSMESNFNQTKTIPTSNSTSVDCDDAAYKANPAAKEACTNRSTGVVPSVTTCASNSSSGSENYATIQNAVQTYNNCKGNPAGYQSQATINFDNIIPYYQEYNTIEKESYYKDFTKSQYSNAGYVYKCPPLNDVYDFESTYTGNAVWEDASEYTTNVIGKCRTSAVQLPNTPLPNRYCGFKGIWGPVNNPCGIKCPDVIDSQDNSVLWSVPTSLTSLTSQYGTNPKAVSISGQCRPLLESTGVINTQFKRTCDFTTGTWGQVTSRGTCNTSLSCYNATTVTNLSGTITDTSGNVNYNLLLDINNNCPDCSPVFSSSTVGLVNAKIVPLDLTSSYTVTSYPLSCSTYSFLCDTNKVPILQLSNQVFYKFKTDGTLDTTKSYPVNQVLIMKFDLDYNSILTDYNYYIGKTNELSNLQSWLNTLIYDNQNYTMQWQWNCGLEKPSNGSVITNNTNVMTPNNRYQLIVLMPYDRKYTTYTKSDMAFDLAFISPVVANEFMKLNNITNANLAASLQYMNTSYNLLFSQTNIQSVNGVKKFYYIIYDTITGQVTTIDKISNTRTSGTTPRDCNALYGGFIGHNTVKNVFYTATADAVKETYVASLYCYDGVIAAYQVNQINIPFGNTQYASSAQAVQCLLNNNNWITTFNNDANSSATTLLSNNTEESSLYIARNAMIASFLARYASRNTLPTGNVSSTSSTSSSSTTTLQQQFQTEYPNLSTSIQSNIVNQYQQTGVFFKSVQRRFDWYFSKGTPSGNLHSFTQLDSSDPYCTGTTCINDAKNKNTIRKNCQNTSWVDSEKCWCTSSSKPCG